MVNAIDFSFSTLHTISLCEDILHKHGANIRSDSLKTGISSGRSIQICCVCKRGPVAIELFCLLIFTLSIVEIPLCKGHIFMPVI